MTTIRLQLPELAASQAQKHVTHNEALEMLDALVQLSARSRSLAVAPSAPAAGDRYLVPAGAVGAWAGMADKVAAWADGAWTFYTPRPGWLCHVEDEGLLVYGAGGWSAPSALAPCGASVGLRMAQDLVDMSGASVDAALAIPARAIVLAVSTRTVEAIGGASAYDCGIPGETAKFGGSLGVAAGSSNIGVIGPTAFYSPTPIRLTAQGSAFSAGKVRVALHYLAFTAPAF